MFRKWVLILGFGVVALLLYRTYFFNTYYKSFCKDKIKNPEERIGKLNSTLINKMQASNAAVLFVTSQDLDAVFDKLNKERNTYYKACFKVKENAVEAFWFNSWLWGRLEIRFKDSRPYFFITKINVFGIPLPTCCKEKINKQILTEYTDYFDRAGITNFKIVNMSIEEERIKIYVEKK